MHHIKEVGVIVFSSYREFVRGEKSIQVIYREISSERSKIVMCMNLIIEKQMINCHRVNEGR